MLNFKTTKEIEISPKIIDQIMGQDEAVKLIKKAAKQRRNILLIGDPGTGKCIGKDTSIITNEGIINASNLYNILKWKETKTFDGIYNTPEKQLYTYSINKNGQLEKSLISRSYKGDKKRGLKLTTASGSTIILSGEHPTLTINQGSVGFLESQNLKIGSWIGTIRELPIIEKKDLEINSSDTKFKGNNNRISLNLKAPLEITEELAYFLGIYVAEGYYDGTIKIYNENQIIKEKIKQSIIHNFNYPAREFSDKDRGVRILKSRTLTNILQKYFNVSLERKNQAYKKRVPQIIFYSDKRIISSFLSGYIDGDGYFGRTGFEASSASKELIFGLKTLFLILGIQSRVRKVWKCATNTKNKEKRMYWQINIYDTKNLSKLYNNLSLIINYKTDALRKLIQKKSNTNVDIIPEIGNLLHQLKTENDLTYNDLKITHGVFLRIVRGEMNISREHLQRLLQRISTLIRIGHSNQNIILPSLAYKKLEFLANANIFWDRITKIEEIYEDVYDFEVKENHNFISAEGFIIHNSMLGQALAELLPEETLKDIISIPNSSDENNPIIKEVPKGEGKKIITKSKLQAISSFKNQNIFFFILLIISVITPWWIRSVYGDIMAAASLIGSMIFLASFVIFINLSRRIKTNGMQIPKLLVDNSIKDKNLFIDATGAHDGALLGDVLHDPLQSLHSSSNININGKEKKINNIINNLLKKHKNEIIKKGDYQATFLNKNELNLLAEKDGKIQPVEVLSLNKYKSDKPYLYKIITESGKTLLVTPEHKIAVNNKGKKQYIEASKLKKGKEVFVK